MWYLKVSSSLYIAVALICMIQNSISLTVDQTTEDQWSKLASSTDQNDLKKILKLCKNSINSFNEKLENTKTIVNKKLPEPNKTTEDIEKLVSDVKTQIKNSSADLVTVRKLVQKTALRFRDTFKSLVSFTELDNEFVNKELEGIKKTTVDSKKPLVNRVVRSFGNRYDLNKLANRVLEISADREKLKNNYDEKKKIAKKELNSLWNSLTNHSKTVNDNALKAFETFFEGMKSLKSVKKKVKTIGEDAINEIKKGNDFNNLKNAVELAKALKLKFEDEWNLDSGELTYSEEQKKDTKKTMDENSVEDNEYDNSTNDIEPSSPTTEQETIDNEKINAIPSTQFEIEKPSTEDSLTLDKAVSEVEETQLPTESEDKVQTTKLQPTIKDDLPDDNISDNINSPIEETSIIPNTENKKNKEKPIMVESKDSNNETNPTDGIKSDLSNNETTFNPDITNDETLISPNKNAENNKQNKIINRRTSREKNPILPWQKLIQLDDPQVSQQSKKCESLLNNITPDFDNIKKSAKNSIQVTKNYKTLQKIENETIQRFYDKMVDTNTKLSDYLVNSAEDVCAKVTPINKRYETKFKNDPNIKRIKYLLGKQYDPNQYILKVLDDASHKTGIGGMKKTTYYKMLAVAHNLNHETKEMEDAALYAMNKIYEGKLAATNLQKMFNKEKASKACYIRNILLEKENDAEKKNKDENKEKVKENINNDTNTEPLKPDVNLDSVDDIQPSTINDDNEPTLNNEEEETTLNDKNESTIHNNLGDNENDNTIDEKENTTKENGEQETEENYNISSIPQNKDSDSTTQTTNDEANKPKRNITRKVTHHRKHRNPNDPNDVSEEYDTIEEIDDEEDVTNEYKSNENKSNITPPEAESLFDSDNKQEVAEPEQSENENGEQKNEENYNISSIPQNKDSDSTTQTTNDGANNPKSNITRKVTHHRKHRNPNDPNDVSEEYDTIEEIDDEEDVTNEYKSNENKSNITPEAESLFDSDNKQEVAEPEQSENENGEQKTEENYNISSIPQNKDSDSTTQTTNDGANNPKRNITRKVTHHRKHRNPNDPNDVSEEYDTIEEIDDEEDVTNEYKSNENKSNITPEAESLFDSDNKQEVAEPEQSENENGEQKTEENYNISSIPQNKDSDSTTQTTNDGANNPKRNITRKVTHHRKHRNPNDPNDVSEEYDTIEEIDDEEDVTNEYKSNENKSNITPPEAESLFDSDNKQEVEEPEQSEKENGESNEETTEEGAPNKLKTHRRIKRKDPKDGKEISEEYDEEEDGNKLNQPNEKTFVDTKKPESPVSADNQEGAVEPEHLQNENVESNEENNTPADISEGDNSGESKTKRRRKLKDPKDGKEISEEYDEEDDENKLNQPNEKTFVDTEKPESPVSADNQKGAVEPEHLQNENVESNEENNTPADISQGDNSGESKTKRRRKLKDPKDGKEISEEYDEEDDENKLNQPNEKTFVDTEKPESPVSADNQKGAVEPEHLQNENVESNEENNTPADISQGDNSGESKTKRRRKLKDPKDGKEISEEYDEEEDGNKLNQPNEKTFVDTEKTESPVSADNQEGAVEPEHLQNENVESNEENNTPADISEGDNSGESKKKRRRIRKNPKDRKKYPEENDTFEEDDNSLNKLKEKKILIHLK